MPNLNLNFLNSLDCDYKDFHTFIETGTFNAVTIQNMEPYFNKLHSIEIKKEFVIQARRKNKSEKITFHHGDSSIVLPRLLPGISSKSIIFLDGHYSANSTGRGDKDVPLYEELESIIKYHEKEAVIIIDDVRLFGTNNQVDFTDINTDKIFDVIKSRLTKKYYLPSEIDSNDRLVVHIS